MSVKRSRESELNFTEKDVSHLMSWPIESAKEVPGAASSEVMKLPLNFLRPTLDEGNKGNFWPDAVLNPAHGAKKVRCFGEFPKACHHCTKEIDQREDVYMYREWCVFCSVECRDRQMERDDKFQKEYEESYNADLANMMK